MDACPAYGSRGHYVKTREVLVGYTCSQHSTKSSYSARSSSNYDEGCAGNGLVVDSFIGDASIPLTRTEDIELGNTLNSEECSPQGKNVEATVDRSLRSRLLARVQRVLDTNEQFIPVGDLKEILTDDIIEVELQNHGLGHLSSFVFRRGKRVFAILLAIQKLGALRDLMKKDYGDKHLPMEDAKLCSVFSNWSHDTRKQFIEFQWTLLAPVFSEGQHLILADDTRLPFIKTEPIASGENSGGVHRIEIHRDHENFEDLRSSTSQKRHIFALKQFTRGTADLNKQTFERELAVMRSVRPSCQSHIVTLLASFEHRGRYSMILPLADENLRQYWAHARSSSLEHHQFLKQMADLATALSYLHNDLVTQDSKPLAGYHMDLKPENILVEFDSSSCLYRLRISDFGSSKIRPKESSQELPPHPGLGTYEPPECQMELPISQAYDIWSLGCIYLECTAWLIKGSGAIDAFAEDRLNDVEIAGNVFKDDYFFTLEFDEFSNPIQAITRPAVIKWVRDLQGDPKCSDGIAQLLLVISNGLLQVERSKRIKAEWLHQRLELLHTSKMPMEFYSK